MAEHQQAENPEHARVIKEGWLYREEIVQGSLSTWKKRWNVLTLLKLQCFKSNLPSVRIFFFLFLFLV